MRGNKFNLLKELKFEDMFGFVRATEAIKLQEELSKTIVNQFEQFL